MDEMDEAMGEDALCCPHCDGALDTAPGSAPIEAVCPVCGGMVVIAAADGTVEAPEPEERLMRPSRVEGELDGLKIRNLTVGRRARIRARSYALIAGLGCVFAVMKLLLMASEIVAKSGWAVRPAMYVGGAMAAAAGTGFFFRRAMMFHREIVVRPVAEALPAPDFSALSDGSQTWRELDRYGGGIGDSDFAAAAPGGGSTDDPAEQGLPLEDEQQSDGEGMK